MTRISVAIATFNGEKYIFEQISSILHQLSANDEIIVSDDHSTDNTLGIINQFNDSRIKIISNIKEKGYTSNFENALMHCKGDYIFLSDQDDVWYDSKVDICMKYLENADFVVSNCKVSDECLNIIHESFFKFRNSYYSLAGNVIKFSFLGCSFAFKKEILSKALPFPANRMLCTHDNWLYLIGAFYFKSEVILEPLFIYRRHISNASLGGAKSPLKIHIKIIYRVYLIVNLLFKIFK